MQVICQKHVRVLRVDAGRRQGLDRKIGEVLRYDHVAASDNGGRQHVPVIGVRQRQGRDQGALDP